MVSSYQILSSPPIKQCFKTEPLDDLVSADPVPYGIDLKALGSFQAVSNLSDEGAQASVLPAENRPGLSAPVETAPAIIAPALIGTVANFPDLNAANSDALMPNAIISAELVPTEPERLPLIIMDRFVGSSKTKNAMENMVLEPNSHNSPQIVHDSAVHQV